MPNLTKARAICPKCQLMFTSVSAFDAHQKMPEGEVICSYPADIGFEEKEPGLWGRPRPKKAPEHWKGK
jgi:hypothetical protein